jgi:hypothetical protein
MGLSRMPMARKRWVTRNTIEPGSITYQVARRFIPGEGFADLPRDPFATTPSHQRLRPDDRHRPQDRWEPSILLEKEQTIAVRELGPTTHLALKHYKLTSERGILSLKSADRPKRRNQQPQNEEEQRDHRGRRYVFPSRDQTDEVFGTHSRPLSGDAPFRKGCRVSGAKRDSSARSKHYRFLTQVDIRRGAAALLWLGDIAFP